MIKNSIKAVISSLGVRMAGIKTEAILQNDPIDEASVDKRGLSQIDRNMEAFIKAMNDKQNKVRVDHGNETLKTK